MSAVLWVAAMPGCRPAQEDGVDCVIEPPTPGVDAVCQVPGWADRDVIVRLPLAYAPSLPMPLVVALHGGGGQKEGMDSLTCAGGDETSSSCLARVADREGFIVVAPDGLANALGFRSWNHGGNAPGLHCSHACERESDDVAYIAAVLDELARIANVDADRVYVTGFSNGAGMSHRLACELSTRVAAIGPVAGADQFSLSNLCEPARAVPVLAIHGTEDPCWPFEGGEGTCLASQSGRYAGVEQSMVGDDERPGWARRHGCAPDPEQIPLPDRDGDGRGAIHWRFRACAADVELIVVEGAGHAWPGGHQYLDASRIGRRSEDFDATEVLWQFFARQRL